MIARQFMYGDINLVELKIPSFDSANQTAIENRANIAAMIFLKNQFNVLTGMPFKLRTPKFIEVK